MNNTLKSHGTGEAENDDEVSLESIRSASMQRGKRQNSPEDNMMRGNSILAAARAEATNYTRFNNLETSSSTGLPEINKPKLPPIGKKQTIMEIIEDIE